MSKKIKQICLNSTNILNIVKKDTRRMSYDDGSTSDYSNITNIDIYDNFDENMNDKDFDEYVINYPIYTPPSVFNDYLQFYINTYAKKHENKDLFLFPLPRLILLLAIFFGSTSIAKKINVEITSAIDVMKEIGCSLCSNTDEKGETVKIKNITIGNISLRYIHYGACFNILQNNYRICLTEALLSDGDK